MDIYFNKQMLNCFIRVHLKKKSNTVNFKNCQLKKKNLTKCFGSKFYPKILPLSFVFPCNFMRIMGCYLILYRRAQHQSLNRRNREFGTLLEHSNLGNSCFLPGSIVSNIHMKCCLTLSHCKVFFIVSGIHFLPGSAGSQV